MTRPCSEMKVTEQNINYWNWKQQAFSDTQTTERKHLPLLINPFAVSLRNISNLVISMSRYVLTFCMLSVVSKSQIT